MNTIILFLGLNLFHVIITTIKSILVVNGNKWAAALSSAFTNFVYTYVLIYMQIDGITTLQKAIIVGGSYLVGVFLVKWVAELIKKDKLWVYQCTAKEAESSIKDFHSKLKSFGIKSVYNEIVKDELYSLQIFSYTSKESKLIKMMLENYDIKYHVIETK